MFGYLTQLKLGLFLEDSYVWKNNSKETTLRFLLKPQIRIIKLAPRHKFSL